MAIALTNILHDGKLFAAGTEVTMEDFGESSWKVLVASGAIEVSEPETESESEAEPEEEEEDE